MSVRVIAEKVNLDRETVCRILIEELYMTKVWAKIVLNAVRDE